MAAAMPAGKLRAHEEHRPRAGTGRPAARHRRRAAQAGGQNRAADPRRLARHRLARAGPRKHAADGAGLGPGHHRAGPALRACDRPPGRGGHPVGRPRRRGRRQGPPAARQRAGQAAGRVLRAAGRDRQDRRLQPAARPGRLGAAHRLRPGLCGGRGLQAGQGLAGALLRHGRRRPQRCGRLQQRHRALRRHRPGAARAGPEHHPGRPCPQGHGAAVRPAPRHGGDGFLREARTAHRDPARAPAGGGAAGRAARAAGAEDRVQHLEPAARRAPLPQRLVRAQPRLHRHLQRQRADARSALSRRSRAPRGR